jgi:predicted nucleotidyltransferase
MDEHVPKAVTEGLRRRGVDVLVTFSPDSDWGVDHLLDMKEELEALFGRAVDLVEKR